MGVLPPLPPGNFVRIHCNNIGGPVYLYQYHKTMGCRNTKSSAHICLPEVLCVPVKSLPVPPPERKGIGNIYFDNIAHKYTILDEENKEAKVLKLGAEENMQRIVQPIAFFSTNTCQLNSQEHTKCGQPSRTALTEI